VEDKKGRARAWGQFREPRVLYWYRPDR